MKSRTPCLRQRFETIPQANRPTILHPCTGTRSAACSCNRSTPSRRNATAMHWPHQPAGYHVRGQAHFAVAAWQAALTDFEAALALVTKDVAGAACGAASVDIGDVRIWLQTTQERIGSAVCAARGANRPPLSAIPSVATRPSCLTLLPRSVLATVFSWCSPRELCRLETVCYDWNAVLVQHRHVLWKPWYQRTRGLPVDQPMSDTRCVKSLFRTHYRPRTVCAHCGVRYDPVQNTSGCTQNYYHPGEYVVLPCPTLGCETLPHYCFTTQHRGWSCCQRADAMERAFVPDKRVQVPGGRVIWRESVPDTLRDKYAAWPAHLGRDGEYVDLPCTRGCTPGPHTDTNHPPNDATFCINRPEFDPLRKPSVMVHVSPNSTACQVCSPHSRTRGNSQERAECWNAFLAKYQMVRVYMRTGRLDGVDTSQLWWKLNKVR